MTIYAFKPTFLYIKQHTVTGKLYFGKTTKSPEKYLGSGVHWTEHIKKHGKKHVVNIWYCLFLDEEMCTEFALRFSRENDIVNSVMWLNIREENGMDGAPVGHEGVKHTDETIKLMSLSTKKMWEDNRETIIENQKNAWTPERRKEQSIRLSGEKRPEHSEIMIQKYIDNPELRVLVSVRMKNLIRTDEHCARISSSLTGKPKSEEHKRKLSVPKKYCYCQCCGKKVVAKTLKNHEICGLTRDNVIWIIPNKNLK